MVGFYPCCVLANAVCPYMQRIVDCLQYAECSSKYIIIGGHIVDAIDTVVS